MRPWTTHGGKMVHASVQKLGDPSTRRDRTWGAHERLTIRRRDDYRPKNHQWW